MATANQNQFENMYAGLKKPMSVTRYTLMRGVTDFGNLKQYDLFESGYPFLIVVDYPKFLQKLKKVNTEYENLINNYLHILEYEFRGLDGLDNITGDTQELTNGINTLNLITKVNEQSNGTFSMRFFEKSGLVITKTHELFLKGVKDSRTQLKTYHGLIDSGDIINPGFHNEVFTFLYFITDNTGAQVERAYLLIACQPTTAEINIVNSEKGNIEFKELTVEFNGFPYTSAKVNQAAKDILGYINGFTYAEDGNWATYGNGKAHMYRSSDNFDYTAYPNLGETTGAAIQDSSNKVSQVPENYKAATENLPSWFEVEPPKSVEKETVKEGTYDAGNGFYTYDNFETR